jgi:hypothetical protein
MKNADLTDGDLFSDEVKVNLHMLGALVLNGVVGEVYGTYVVAVDERTPLQQTEHSMCDTYAIVYRASFTVWNLYDFYQLIFSELNGFLGFVKYVTV